MPTQKKTIDALLTPFTTTVPAITKVFSTVQTLGVTVLELVIEAVLFVMVYSNLLEASLHQELAIRGEPVGVGTIGGDSF